MAEVSQIPERRSGERRADMAHDDLRELIKSERSARERDQAIYDRRIDKLEARVERLISRSLLLAGALIALAYLLDWIGPTVVRRAIDTMMGVSP